MEKPKRKTDEASYPVRAFVGRLQREEPFDRDALLGLRRALILLMAEWRPMSTARAWREMGAPGGDDAVEGLAQERRQAIQRAEQAEDIVVEAINATDGTYVETRRARMVHDAGEREREQRKLMGHTGNVAQPRDRVA